jgi:hypothetical protein
MPAKATFSLRTLVGAVRQRVDETSIRAVAEELGMSPSGLHVLLGGTRPHPATLEKLVSWYVERRRSNPGSAAAVAAVDVDAAIRLLVHYVGQDGRESTQAERLRQILRRLETESGVSGARTDK